MPIRAFRRRRRLRAIGRFLVRPACLCLFLRWKLTPQFLQAKVEPLQFRNGGLSHSNVRQ